MQREIMFRGQRVDTKEWVYGYLFGSWERRYILWGTTNGIPNMIEVIPETIGQYTGQNDKNDKKIYENDVVNIDDDIAIIKWNNDSSRFTISLQSTVYDFDNTYSHELEIIGNTHDNQELLEEVFNRR